MRLSSGTIENDSLQRPGATMTFVGTIAGVERRGFPAALIE
jgi:hypothetical protein